MTVEEEHKRWSCIYFVRSEGCCSLTKHTCKGSGCGKWEPAKKVTPVETK